jgi:hypothetical protein
MATGVRIMWTASTPRNGLAAWPSLSSGMPQAANQCAMGNAGSLLLSCAQVGGETGPRGN